MKNDTNSKAGRFIVLILDGFGIGATADAAVVRPQDKDSNTCRSVFRAQPGLMLPNLERLGLANAVGEEYPNLKFSASASYGQCALMHFGADTFYGHQEIMGTLPRKPNKRPFSELLPVVRQTLLDAGYRVEIAGDKLKYLFVNNCLTIADNIEADYGSAYNITASFDRISFEEVLRIGKIVRNLADVSRVIAFGGEGVEPAKILAAAQEKEDRYIGINAPLSGVYDTGYLVQHLGYGINPAVQVPGLLADCGVQTFLAGKVADIVDNEAGESYSIVDTAKTMEKAVQLVADNPSGFICVNVQETDISGHLQSAELFAEKLQLADCRIQDIIGLMNEQDILIVTADHGNDPLIGHSRHTRENTPLLIYGSELNCGRLGLRKTLSDIGQTVCEYFGAEKCENGESFLDKITGRSE